MTSPDAPFTLLPPHERCRVTVVIPARDEAEHIGRTIAALAAQCEIDGAPLDPDLFDVLVYANNCSDATADVARAAAACHPAYRIFIAEEHLPPNVAHIGTARRAAMHAAAARFGELRPDAVLAATDADTVASPTWLAWTLREMGAADVVTGRILVDPAEFAALPEHTRRMLDEENAYQFAVAQLTSILQPKPYDPWPRHWQRSGPSLAVRVGAYMEAGGVPPVRALEDIALYDALDRNGARIRHSLRVRVTTSARFGSRAPGGFGTRIGEWSALGDRAMPLLVEHPDVTIARLYGSEPGPSIEDCPRAFAVEATAALRAFIRSGERVGYVAEENAIASQAGVSVA